MRFIQDVVIRYDGDDCLLWPYARTGQGYGNISVNKRNRPVSALVCEIVHGPPPTPRHEAAHSCGRGREGCVTPNHLRWATHSDNETDKLQHGTYQFGEQNPFAKLTEADVRQIRLLKGRFSQREIGEMFGVNRGTVRLIHVRETWAWLTD